MKLKNYTPNNPYREKVLDLMGSIGNNKELLTAGKTSTRDHFYSLGKANGMSKDEMDKLIGWNDTTKEVTFDGRSLGKPDVGVDGVSYWKDTSALDKAFNDYLNRQSKVGKTPTRDYFYSLGKGRGMSNEEIDALIGWDNDTGEVTFGGKKIGKPDAAYDGKSYWSDTSVLDNAFNDWVSRSGHTVDEDLIKTQHNTGVKDKIDQLWGIKNVDRSAMASKYNKLEDTAYSNPFESDVAKAILGKYDLAALQGRDNAVASGSATNGGNIDSFAAANAMRQQAALTNQGQMAVLEAHNQKLDKIKGILESLGVYQQNQDAGMRDIIGLEQTEAQRLFENDETAKNNETARLEVEAGVTGYTPTKWAIKNDDVYSQFLNEDGSFKKEMENIDIQTLINYYKANGDDATAKKLAVVRGRKLLSNYGVYGKYANAGDVSFMTPQQTEAGRQFDVNNKTVLESLKTEEKIATDNNQTNKEINSDKNASNERINNAQIEAEQNAKAQQAEQEAYFDAQFESLQNLFATHETRKRSFVTEKLKPLFDKAKKGETFTEKTVSDLIIKHSADYNIDVDDAKNICNLLGVGSSWVTDYENDPDNIYGGMIRKTKK